MSTQDTTLPPLPHPLLIAGGKNWFTIEQMHAYARAAIAAQAPQPLPKDASDWNGSFEQAWRMGHCTRSKELTDDVRAQIEREVRAQQAQGVPGGFVRTSMLAAAPQAEPVHKQSSDIRAVFEAWVEGYPIQIVEDDYEMCFDAFQAGYAVKAEPQPEREPLIQIATLNINVTGSCTYVDVDWIEPARNVLPEGKYPLFVGTKGGDKP